MESLFDGSVEYDGLIDVEKDGPALWRDGSCSSLVLQMERVSLD